MSYEFDKAMKSLTEANLEWSNCIGWGPGGQAVNKTTSAVFLKHLPTGSFIA